MTMPKRYNWKVFLIIWLATVFGVIAILPYSLTLSAANSVDDRPASMLSRKSA